ncbi:hypothetical protein [Ideonella sp. B508-1]|uniref:hypothetical protein n=1 Tax=Ideonella sp. B508-1 TaxID=137716 RepID=UPI0011D1E61C|nr:hypothetical protein [Ideonella sp. B508-1]
MKQIFEAIAEYAQVYEKLEQLQEAHRDLMPKGDQKTGVIAEFYARLYAQFAYPGAHLIYGTTSEHAWDITIQRDGYADHKIQVKAVSIHSTTSRVSNIHPGWHELYLLRLDRALYPEGFWTILASDAPWATEKIVGKTMPHRARSGSGSQIFRQACDKLGELNAVLQRSRA